MGFAQNGKNSPMAVKPSAFVFCTAKLRSAEVRGFKRARRDRPQRTSRYTLYPVLSAVHQHMAAGCVCTPKASGLVAALQEEVPRHDAMGDITAPFIVAVATLPNTA